MPPSGEVEDRARGDFQQIADVARRLAEPADVVRARAREVDVAGAARRRALSNNGRRRPPGPRRRVALARRLDAPLLVRLPHGGLGPRRRPDLDAVQRRAQRALRHVLAAPVALPVLFLEPPEARRAGLVAAALERRNLHAVVVANGALARLVRERRRRQRRGQGRRPPRRRRQRQAVVAAQERVRGGPGNSAAPGRRRPRGLRGGLVAELVPPGPQRRLGAPRLAQQLAEDARPVDAAAHARRRDGPAQRGVLVGRPRRLRHAGPRPFP